MRFTQGRRRQAPSVIIVSLIDVLLVVLIFLMVTMTFRQTPAIKLSLPEAKASEKGGADSERLVVTVARGEPSLYLGTRSVSFEELQEGLKTAAAGTTNLSLSIQGDEGAPWGLIVKVVDAAKAANILKVDAITKGPGAK